MTSTSRIGCAKTSGLIDGISTRPKHRSPDNHQHCDDGTRPARRLSVGWRANPAVAGGSQGIEQSLRMQRVATIGRLRLWHQSPKNTECDQSYHGDCHKTGCQSEVSHDHTGECGTERSSDTGNRTDKALGEVESARAASRVSNRQWLQYTEHDSADAIQDLDGNQDHWFRNQRKQQ